MLNDLTRRLNRLGKLDPLLYGLKCRVTRLTPFNISKS